MNWLSRNAESIEAIAATLTAVVAVAALIGVKFQLDETDRLQKSQSARDSYRAHLSLAVTHPDFAQPVNACSLLGSEKSGAYQAFVDHLLYSAEQMLSVDPGWEATFLNQLDPHASYLCSDFAPLGETHETDAMLAGFRKTACTAAVKC